MAQALEEVRKQREEFQEQVRPTYLPVCPGLGVDTGLRNAGHCVIPLKSLGRWEKNIIKKPSPRRMAL